MAEKNKIYYRCEFEFNHKALRARSPFLDTFIAGFWIGEDLRLARVGEERYWIPPHAISHIAKDWVTE